MNVATAKIKTNTEIIGYVETNPLYAHTNNPIPANKHIIEYRSIFILLAP